MPRISPHTHAHLAKLGRYGNRAIDIIEVAKHWDGDEYDQVRKAEIEKDLIKIGTHVKRPIQVDDVKKKATVVSKKTRTVTFGGISETEEPKTTL
eukprot:scaffold266326_cov71-Attheya_sp.AAC.1